MCRWCIVTKGLHGSELDTWPTTDDDEGIAKHIETEHNIPVRRVHETNPQCRERFAREHPEAADPTTCKCPSCANARELLARRRN